MKNKIMMAVLCLGVVLCFVASLPAQQMSDRQILTVNVPFNFTAGGMSLPAGQYEVLHVMNPSWIMLRTSDRNAIALVHVSVSPTTTESANNKLVFNRYRDKYFLSQVWTSGDYQVHNCTPTNAESSIALQSNDAVAVAQQ
ncbi:MAG TPA: hypothetical protein VKB58_11050 [Terriglobales bacterium]|nr:hypothetical protein [Terriglobales bacterium]